MHHRLAALAEHGQSIWLDYIDRALLADGGLAALIDTGITGVTTNPSIFHKAITSGDRYDDDIRAFVKSRPTADAEALLETLMVADVTVAADALAPVYQRTNGLDGFVSIEVSPLLAHDSDATLEAARRLHAAVDRPNLMVKIPATPAGLPAINATLADGINVNVTLLFAVDRYVDVMRAWREGLDACEHPENVASVASFFVSRIDTKVDAALDANGSREAKALRGRIAIANARLAYSAFEAFMQEAPTRRLLERGVPVQRLLFGSTGTKDPGYPDVKYVDGLIGRDTVNTLPPATLDALLDHGEVAATLPGDVAEAGADVEVLEGLGIDFAEVTATLEREGVAAFEDAHRALLEALDTRMQGLRAG